MKTDGLHQGGKFNVSRKDGNEGPGTKHDGCWYFVLDVTHDPFARQALATYAGVCSEEFPELSRDLIAMLAAPEGETHIIAGFGGEN
jgi:hypothetical protein